MKYSYQINCWNASTCIKYWRILQNSLFPLKSFKISLTILVYIHWVNHFWISNAKVNFSPKRTDISITWKTHWSCQAAGIYTPISIVSKTKMEILKTNTDFYQKEKTVKFTKYVYFIRHRANGFICCISFGLYSNPWGRFQYHYCLHVTDGTTES